MSQASPIKNKTIFLEKMDHDLCVNCCDKDDINHKMVKHSIGLEEDFGSHNQKQTNPQESGLFCYHAKHCKDYDLCVNCCDKDGINHKMEKLSIGLEEDSGTCEQKQTNPQELRLFCYHAKHCQEAKRPVTCFKIKRNFRQQRLQQAQILKQRIITMQNRLMSNAVPQTSPGNSNSSSQLSPCAQPHSSPHPFQPGIGIASMNYGKGNPVNPPTAITGLMTTHLEMQTQMQKPISQMMSGVPNRMLNMGNVACWEGSGYAQNCEPHQNPQPQPTPQIGIREQAQIMRPGNIPNSIGSSAMGPPQVMPNPGHLLREIQRTTLDWLQIFQDLKYQLRIQALKYRASSAQTRHNRF